MRGTPCQSGGRLRIEAANAEIDEGLARELGGLAPGRLRGIDGRRHRAPGMSEDVMAHIFEPFFTTKAAAFGGGLGLAEVYGIVNQNGGRITVSSHPGRGSAFRIYLPRVPAPPDPAVPVSVDSPKSEAEPEIGGYTVLIVDDEASVRKLIRQALEPHGCTILEAGGGQEALSVAAAHGGRIDIAIVDFMMPGLNGLDLALQMERDFPGSEDLIRFVGDRKHRHGQHPSSRARAGTAEAVYGGADRRAGSGAGAGGGLTGLRPARRRLSRMRIPGPACRWRC